MLSRPTGRVIVLVVLLAAVFTAIRLANQPSLAISVYALIPIMLSVFWFELAGGLATDVGVGQATLTLGKLTLARHAQLSLSSAAGPILIAVDAGRLDVSAWGMAWGRGWVRRGTDGMSIAVDEAAVGEGDGLLLHPGGTITLRNGGGKPAVVLVLTLRSGPASPPVGRATFPP